MTLANTPHPAGYRRLHILPVRLTIEALAVFLVSALLVSHGVRRDALAAVNLGEKWLWVPGDKVRYLAPDLDTAEGWVKAALKGKKGLGAVDASGPPDCAGAAVLHVVSSHAGVTQGTTLEAAPRYCVYYHHTMEGVAGAGLVVGLNGAPIHLGPIIANILLDRAEAGLEAYPTGYGHT